MINRLLAEEIASRLPRGQSKAVVRGGGLLVRSESCSSSPPPGLLARAYLAAYPAAIRPVRVLTFGALVLVAVLGQAGIAWAGWSQPVRVAAGATYPVVGLDDRGDAVAVWMEGSSGGGLDRIFASQRLA